MAMHLFMAGAEGDQVRFGVITAVAAKFLVVNFQVRSPAAQLASPAVSRRISCRSWLYGSLSRGNRGRLGRAGLSIRNLRSHLAQTLVAVHTEETGKSASLSTRGHANPHHRDWLRLESPRRSSPGSSRAICRCRASELPSRSPANHGSLAPVQLEIDDLPGLVHRLTMQFWLLWTAKRCVSRFNSSPPTFGLVDAGQFTDAPYFRL
jgi:hypothetical protein